jgi:hypothetical protein
MTPEQRQRLRRFRQEVVSPAARPAPVEPPADPRPRFSTGPLKGQLRDERQRLEEQLGIGGPPDEVAEWLPIASADPGWRTIYDQYEKKFGPSVHAEQRERDAAADLQRVAERLAVDPAKFSDPTWRAANGPLIPAAERRARVREQHAELSAELERELPPEVETPENAPK